MSESKHTTGPWIAFSDEIDDNTNIVSIADRTRLVLILKGRHKSEPDVRLITAAPELLEALENLINNCECRETGTVIADFSRKTPVDAARAAIAKAKGKQL